MALIEQYASAWYECPRCWASYELKLETEQYPETLPCTRCEGQRMRVVGTSFTETFDDGWPARWEQGRE